MTIAYRTAERSDCPGLAEFMRIASGGVLSYLFHDLVPGLSPVQVVSRNLEKDVYPHTFKQARVAVDDDETVGMVLSYPAEYHRMTDEMRDFFPPDRMTHLASFFNTRCENTWFVDTLCVAATHQRRGIGGELLARAAEMAREKGFDSLSLMVFCDNTPALGLYEQVGFRRVKPVRLPGNERIPHEGGCWLMQWDLPGRQRH